MTMQRRDVLLGAGYSAEEIAALEAQGLERAR